MYKSQIVESNQNMKHFIICSIVFIMTILCLKYDICTGDAGTVISDIVVIILATVDVPININDIRYHRASRTNSVGIQCTGQTWQLRVKNGHRSSYRENQVNASSNKLYTENKIPIDMVICFGIPCVFDKSRVD